MNHSQTDTDDDGIGDVCDLCPGDDSGYWFDRRQNDRDRDEVGDECDFAPGIEIAHLRCTADAFCAANHAGFCAIEPGDADGRCSSQKDSDDDRVEDSIDLCVGPFFGDPLNANSNWIAEQLRYDPTDAPQDIVEVLGDICDDVPIYRVAPQFNATSADLAALPADPDSGRTKEPFVAQPMYGANAPGALAASVVFRHCSCYTGEDGKEYDATVEMDDLECAILRCDTDGAEHAQGRWRKASVEDAQTQVTIGPNGALPGVSFNPGFEGDATAFNWLWDDDIRRTDAPVEWRYISPHPFALNLMSANGLLATVVAGRDENWQTRRDDNDQLRVSTERFITPSVYPAEPEWVFGHDEIHRCALSPGCNLWVWDGWLEVINPADVRIRDPFAVVAEANGLDLVSIDTRGGLRGLTASEDLVAYASKLEKFAFVGPSETPQALEASGIAEQAIVVMLGETAPPLVVVREGNALQITATMGMMAAAPERAGVQVEDGVKAIYSATEGRLYLVSADHPLWNFLRAYDLVAGRWASPDWAHSLSPEIELLAAAYDPAARLLHVLQVDQGADSVLVRLVEHNLARHESNVRWEAPWTGAGARYDMVVQPNRRLALIRSANASHDVCSFDPAAATFVGMASGTGVQLGTAAAARDGLQFLASDGEMQAARAIRIHQGMRDPSVGCF